MSPFDVLQQDFDDFVLMANYFIRLGKGAKSKASSNGKDTKQKRIRVNDKTATGGWW